MKKKLFALIAVLLLASPAFARERRYGISFAQNTLKVTNKTGYNMRFYISNLWKTGYNAKTAFFLKNGESVEIKEMENIIGPAIITLFDKDSGYPKWNRAWVSGEMDLRTIKSPVKNGVAVIFSPREGGPLSTNDSEPKKEVELVLKNGRDLVARTIRKGKNPKEETLRYATTFFLRGQHRDLAW